MLLHRPIYRPIENRIEVEIVFRRDRIADHLQPELSQRGYVDGPIPQMERIWPCERPYFAVALRLAKPFDEFRHVAGSSTPQHWLALYHFMEKPEFPNVVAQESSYVRNSARGLKQEQETTDNRIERGRETASMEHVGFEPSGALSPEFFLIHTTLEADDFMRSRYASFQQDPVIKTVAARVLHRFQEFFYLRISHLTRNPGFLLEERTGDSWQARDVSTRNPGFLLEERHVQKHTTTTEERRVPEGLPRLAGRLFFHSHSLPAARALIWGHKPYSVMTESFDRSLHRFKLKPPFKRSQNRFTGHNGIVDVQNMPGYAN